MSIRPEMKEAIRQHVSDKCLILIDKMTIPFNQVRPIYMVPDLYGRIFGPSAEETKRMGFLEVDLRRFINGDKLIVGHEKEETCFLKPMTNCNEVWEVRSRDPKPSLRIFGRFAAKDVFVATNMQHRKLLDHIRSRAFAVEIRKCITTWTRLFPYLEPHTGNSSHDYVSNAVDLSETE
jgi:hypothetical protein